MKKTLYSESQRQSYISAVSSAELPLQVECRAYRDTRSLQANRKMWATLRDISEQVEWYGKRLTSDEWKQMITAAIKKQEVVPGIEGGFVILGQSTSKMTIAQMNDVIEYAVYFGTGHKVVWSDPSDIINAEV